MLFMLILFGSLIGLVVFAFVISRNVEFGEARFDSETGKKLTDETKQPRGPIVPAQRAEVNKTNERKSDNE